MSDILRVWYEHQPVGIIARNAMDQMGFQYDDSWMRHGFPISLQLPLTKKLFAPHDGKAHQFFANLLPESNARSHILRDLKISDSDFELLKAIGGECAGALSILPDNYPLSENASYQKLSEDNFNKMILRKGNVIGFLTEKNRPRLSLAGAQDKCAIFFDQKHFYLPKGSAPSTHILKFEVSGYRHIPAYEYFLTQLAKTIGLPVVDCQFKKSNGHYFLCIARYDRIIQADKKIQRLHQEDFCQALGISHAKKYEEAGGPSFRDCFLLLKEMSTQPLADTENLLKWQIFNVLAGNSDGHAKNLSLLYDEKQRIHLAPFYDLVCTRAIEKIDSRLAFSVGEEFNPDRITTAHWENFAASCRIGKPYVRKLIKKIARSLLENTSTVKKNFEAEHGAYPALLRATLLVTKRCKRVLMTINPSHSTDNAH